MAGCRPGKAAIMTRKGHTDTVTIRREATASLIRSFAWPIVVLIGVWYFGDTIDRIARGLQKFNFAGIEFQRFIDESNLSEEQLKILKKFQSAEIVRFISDYKENSSRCSEDGKLPASEALFAGAGLIVVEERACSDLEFAIVLTAEGSRMRSALARMLEDALRTSISS
jgi:hypothetical protein